jgi:hypothetical protein
MFTKVWVYEAKENILDKYTVVTYVGKEIHFYGMSAYPYGPQSFNQYCGSFPQCSKPGKHLGKKLNYIPMQLVSAIKYRISA